MHWMIKKKIPEYFAEILQFDLSFLSDHIISQISPLSYQVDLDKEKLYEEAFLDFDLIFFCHIHKSMSLEMEVKYKIIDKFVIKSSI